VSIPFNEPFDCTGDNWGELSDEEWIATFMSKKVYYDHSEHDYACICPRFRDVGKCHHLYRLRRQVEVEVDPRYL